MFRKILASTIVLSVLVGWLIASAVLVSAQGPTNDDWTRAIYMYDRAYTMPANTDLWFRFDYSPGDSTSINIMIPGGQERGLEFRVFTPQQAERYFQDDRSIGSGTAPQVPCETGRCTSPDLVWTGSFPIAATYYVKVRNPKPIPIPFRFQLTGRGVSLGQDAPPLELIATPTSTPTLPSLSIFATPLPPPTTISLALLTPIPTIALPQVPVATATLPGAQNTSPFDAIYVPDNRPQSIPANGALWYKFDYSPPAEKSQVTITLPNGNTFGYEFKIYNSEQAARVYQEDVRTGTGTAIMVPCESGRCASPDLTWIGAFNISGTFYVLVNNTKPIPQTFVLRITGNGIDIVGK